MATAQLVLDADVGKWNVIFEQKVIASSTAKYYLRQQVRQGRWKHLGVTDVVDAEWTGLITGTGGQPAELQAVDTSLIGDKFTINERFEFVYKCTQAVGGKHLPSLILSGEGGLGKTHTVLTALESIGLRNLREVIGQQELTEEEELELGAEFNDTTYALIKGYSSPRGLFNALYEHRERVIVFDDCDSVLKDEIASNLLKAALDSYEERWITWNAAPAFGDKTPRSFRFNGTVIFISNMSLNRIDPAVRTRGISIDLSMTLNQIIERMNFIAKNPEYMPDVDISHKLQCMQLIEELKDNIRGLSLRTLTNVIKLKLSCPNDWERMAEYVICR